MVVSLVLAGAGRSGEGLLLQLVGDAGSEHQGLFIYLFLNSIKMCPKVFDLDLTLMSPPGTPQHCSPEDKRRRRRKKCLERVQRETGRDKQNSRNYCNMENRDRQKERARRKLRQVMAQTPCLHLAPERAKIAFNGQRKRRELGHSGGAVGDERSKRIATKQTH